MYHSVEFTEDLNAKENHSIIIHACHFMPVHASTDSNRSLRAPARSHCARALAPRLTLRDDTLGHTTRTKLTLAGTSYRTFIIFLVKKPGRTACRGN